MESPRWRNWIIDKTQCDSADGFREISSNRWGVPLVINYPKLGSLRADAQHSFNKIVPVRGYDPGRA